MEAAHEYEKTLLLHTEQISFQQKVHDDSTNRKNQRAEEKAEASSHHSESSSNLASDKSALSDLEISCKQENSEWAEAQKIYGGEKAALEEAISIIGGIAQKIYGGEKAALEEAISII